MGAYPSLSARYPVATLHLDVPPASLDINLEPNKTSVLLNDMVGIIRARGIMYAAHCMINILSSLPIYNIVSPYRIIFPPHYCHCSLNCMRCLRRSQ